MHVIKRKSPNIVSRGTLKAISKELLLIYINTYA